MITFRITSSPGFPMVSGWIGKTIASDDTILSLVPRLPQLFVAYGKPGDEARR